MIVLSEWLPNPVGSDTNGEWIELANTGPGAASTKGYTIAANEKTRVDLKAHIIPAGGFLVLPRSETHLALKNTDGALSLFDPVGRVVSTAAFVGVAPEGQSANVGPDGLTIFGAPTPGRANDLITAPLIERSFPFDQPLAPSLPWFNVLGLGFFVAVALAVTFVILIKQRDDLAELFFGGY
ncbi:MAG TPA: lamin tail domain-containing protein [Candidatus Paceibacterota bacterium]|nr:lamin tail domain-containing protein [Candidatus Paceibacterota bacterium]